MGANVNTSTMRITLVDFTFFAYSIQLSNALAEYGDVTLLLPDKVPDHYLHMISESVTVRLFHMPRIRYPANLVMIGKIFRIISEIRPHIVHLLAWHPWMNLSLPLLHHKALIATIHDAQRHPGDGIIPFHSWQWRYANQVIVHADAIKRQLVENQHVKKEIVHVIPHGALSNFRIWNDADALEQEGTVLFFGRIRDYKGLRYLIEAEPLITQEVPGLKIVIAGEGDGFQKYEHLMVHKEHFVVHNTFIPDEMVARLFSEASLVVLPYIEASQSGVLTIAYSFGKPVVATSVGGIPEVLRQNETGLLVPPADSLSLAQAVIALLKDPQKRKEMGHNALKMSQTELSWTGIAAQIYQVYRQALL